MQLASARSRLLVCRSRPLAFPLELFAPCQFGRRGLLRTADSGRLYLTIPHIGRGDQTVRRDSAVRQLEQAGLAVRVEQALTLTQEHRESERPHLVNEAGRE